MSDVMIPLLSALAIVGYWVVCRRRSLVYRERAAELLVAYFEKKGVSEEDKNSAERFYMGARHWSFLPVATALAFPVILWLVLSKKVSTARDRDRMEITDSVMKMYLSRNPLTGSLSLVAFFTIALVAQFIGLMINRVRAIPSPAYVYMETADMLHHHRRHAH
ncbi:hypothetical protein [Pseudomonas nitroreducens]|uniref:hypothetical protein n=1 Tax=Pseudomonas nitroreducens TaxID=46680 RepID=UPI002D80F797|nr:hypothetical protein [Pseudomonas nitroreducens]